MPENTPTEPPSGFQEDQPQNNIPIPSYVETPQTSHAPSEADSTQPTTPSSAVTPAPSRQQPLQAVKVSDRPNVAKLPIVPAVPNIPLISRPTKRASISVASEARKIEQASSSSNLHITDQPKPISQADSDGLPVTPEPTLFPPAKAAPKSWADLVKTMAQPIATAVNKVADNHNSQINGFANPKTGSLADALSLFSTGGNNEDSKLSFLEPRGLVNTGNMCYMNSVSGCQTVCYSAFTSLTPNFRFSKSWCFAFLFMTFLRKSASERHTVSKVILHWWMQCKSVVAQQTGFLC